MNMEIGTETPIFLFWEYLFRNFDVTCLTCKPGDGGGRGGGGGGCGGEVVPAPGPQSEQTARRIDRGGINLPRLPFLIHVLLLRILNLKIPTKRRNHGLGNTIGSPIGGRVPAAQGRSGPCVHCRMSGLRSR